MNITDFSLLDDNEYRQIICEWNKTEAEYPRERTVVELFYEQAERTPDNIAAVYDRKSLSYRELNEASNRVANYLISEYGAGPDDIVALCLDRSELMLVSIWGVLKAGCAYAPMGPDYPEERLAYMVRDTGTKVILANGKYQEKLKKAIAAGTARVEAVDEEAFRTKLSTQNGGSPGCRAGPENLSYVIYTSGTTGEPKGVMNVHRGLVNWLHWMNSSYPMREEDRILQKTPYTFDVSLRELLWAVLHGARIVFAKPEGHRDSVYLAELVLQEKVTVIHFVPSMLGVFEETLKTSEGLKESCKSLRYIFCSGEALGLAQVQEAQRLFPQAQIHNLYGPTETSVEVLYYDCNDRDIREVLIGRPIQNTTAYILDENMQPVPIGAAGELYLGGVSLARGYLNKAELTDEKFIANPFQSEEEKEKGYNGRLYKTGDLARYLADGNIEYLGRNDFQVKVRGFRIELGEIENVLGGHPRVSQCAAMARERSGVMYLAAYYAGEATEAELREYLRKKLPEYMVPDTYVRLDELPLSANGKLDRRRLPEPDMCINEEAYEAPANGLEAGLAKQFAEVLGLEAESLSVTGDFFRLGANSIMAIMLANRLQKNMGLQVNVTDIFTRKTVRELAKHARFGRRMIKRIEFKKAEDQKLSYGQWRLWFIDNYEGGSIAYNVPLVGRLKECVAVQPLKLALTELVRRHEALRSIIKSSPDGELYQEVTEGKFIVEERRIERKEDVEKELTREANRPFELGEEIPVRAVLYEAGEDRYLSVVIHHIAFDGWSQDIFMRELVQLYRYFLDGSECLPALEGREYPLGEVKVQYRYYAAWQREYLCGETLEAQLEYWKQRLAGCETLNLLTDRERPAEQQYEGDEVYFEFDIEISGRIREYARELGVSVYTVMLSAYYLLLSVYSGQKDIVVGTLTANRGYEEISGTIGFFVNTLAMRQEIDFRKKTEDFIRETGAAVTEGERYGEAPFEKVVEALGLETDRSRHPVFQAAFSSWDEWWGGYELFEGIKGLYKAAKFDLQVSVEECKERIGTVFNYAVSLFDRETIERYAVTYRQITGELVKGNGKQLCEISFLNDREREHILHKWNMTLAEYPGKRTVVELFEEQAEKTPENTAVVFDGVKLSYREFNKFSNRVANYLVKEYGVGPEDIVVLCLDRSELMPASIWGVLKAGCAYAPLSPDYPEERLRFMLRDTGTKVVLADKCYKEKIKKAIGDGAIQIEAVNSEIFREKINRQSDENPDRRAVPENLAYVIYTSGTTGEPKGVMLEHKGLMNRIHWMNSEYPLREEDRILQKTPYTFDVSVWELTWALLYGAGIVFAKPEGHRDSVYLAELIKKEQVTVIHFVPSMLGAFEETIRSSEELAESCASLRYIFCSGEALGLSHVREAQRLFPGAQIHNLYGPTEASIDVLYYDCNDRNINKVLIGRPIQNTTAYIVDGEMRPLPVGAAGELLIGGVGLARGYLHKPELTAEKFVANPFQSEEEKTAGYNGHLYKTGDLARYLPDGNIEYLGRNDFQVKVRGFRIELGEIENTLGGYRAVKQCAAAVKERAGGKFIAAYYVGEASEKELREYLGERLPEYMVPSAFVQLEQLPLTPNGKLDRRALPDPDPGNVESYEVPANDRESELVHIFADVLGLEAGGISATGDFFRLGGDSILAIKLVSRLRQRLGFAVTVRDIFTLRTARNIAALPAGSTAEQEIETEQGILRGPAELLPIQRWFFAMVKNKSFRKSGHFNQAFTIETPELDIELLKTSIKKLTEYHDAFRLRYREEADGSITQYYADETTGTGLKLANIHGKSETEIEALLSGWQSRFEIYGEKLYSIGYLHGDGKAFIHVAMHHLITDAVSWRIIKDDLEKIYTGLESLKNEGKNFEVQGTEELLGKKGTSYRQWARRVERFGQAVPEEEKKKLEKTREDIKLYQEKIRTLDTGKIDQCEVKLSRRQTMHLLRDIHDKLGTEANDILLGAMTAALGEITGEPANYVTVEGHGRFSAAGVDLSRTIGWFTTMSPVRIESAGLIEMVIRAKESLRELREKEFLYGVVYGYEGTLPGIVYNYLGQFDPSMDSAHSETSGWIFGRRNAGKTVPAENDNGNFLTMNGGILGEELVFSITGRLSGKQMKRFAQAFRKNIEELIAALGSKGRRFLTPSDVHWAVTRKQLDRLQAEREIDAVFPANSLQEGFIYHHLRAGEDDAYIVQLLWNYRCAIETQKMREAWELAVRRHPALRLRFDWEGELVQVIDREGQTDWRYHDIGSESDQDGCVEKLRAADRKELYDLRKGCLFRVYMIKRNENYYTAIYSFHHAIGDGWSNPALLKTVHKLYDELVQTGQRPVVHEDRSYMEAQEYLRRRRTTEDGFWEQYLAKLGGEEDLSSLLKKEKRGETLPDYRQVFENAEESLVINGEAYRRMLAYCAGIGITVNTLVQYAWHKELKVYGNSDITVTGMTVSGRDLPVNGIEESVGLYINTLPVIFEHKKQGKVKEELRELQGVINEITSRSWKRLGGLGKGTSRLFSSLFVYENYLVADGMSGGLEIEFAKAAEKLDYPLGVIASDWDESLKLNVKYAGELFEREKILALLKGMLCIIEQAVRDSGLECSELKFVTGEEYQKIVNIWNDTQMEYPQDQTVVDLFEAQAEKTQDNTAVVYNASLSYRELNDASNRLAWYLIKEYGIGPDDMVALCLERSEMMLVSIMGVMKAGGAYVPMEGASPEDRLAYMIEDTGTKVILADGKYEEKLKNAIDSFCLQGSMTVRAEIVDGEAFRKKMEKESAKNPVRRAGPENLAYVMYTSGTTGKPKGVMIEHRSLMNQIHWMGCEYPLKPKDRILQKTIYTFDVSVWDLLWAILHGAGIVFAKPGGHLDSVYLAELIQKEQVTIIQFVPSMLSAFEETLETVPGLAEKCRTLRYILCIGEALTLSQVKKGQRLLPWAQIHNLYGPTEATLAVTYYSCHDPDIQEVHIGRPMGNTACYILDGEMRLVPIGAVGELHLGGVQVARGYLNKSELTEEKFVPNPFQTEEEKTRGENGRLYKTGDLARYLPDGNIEYLGRNDFQVKIRGVRIELGEIENALSSHPGVRQCAVVAKEREGMKYLAAYYAGDAAVDELREHAERHLPEYMAPGAYMKLEQLPLTANGKLDRKLLPEPETSGGKEEYISPADARESELAGIFAGILGIDAAKLSVQADFFRLGGNSIMAIKLANSIQRELGLPVNVSDIFECRTVRGIGKLGGQQRPAITQVKFKSAEEQKLSYGQGRLWFIENYEEGNSAYNVPMAVKLKDGVPAECVKRALREVVRRHEVLRSVIRSGEGDWYQEVLEWNENLPEIEEVPCADRADVESIIKTDFNYIFRLGEELPIRARIYDTGKEKYISAVVHHIAFDGWSQDIFINELTQLCLYYMEGGEYPLEEVKVQYKDYAAWQREYLSGEVLEKQLEYWKEKLAGYETLNLFTDKERPARQLYEGDDVYFGFDNETSVGIRKRARELGVSVYTVLLSAYYLLLSVYSGQKDIVVGIMAANRGYEEIGALIGFFANTLAMRQEVDTEIDTDEFITGVGEALREAQLNQEIPFEMLVNALGIKPSQDRHPIFQTMFLLQDTDGYLTAESGKIFESLGKNLNELGYGIAKFDLTLTMTDDGEIINGNFNYALSLFNRETIDSYIETYIEIVRQIAGIKV